MSTIGHIPGRRARLGARPLPRLPAGFVLAALVLIALSGAAGWMLRTLGAGTGGPPPAVPVRTADVGRLAVSVPATWAPAPAAELRLRGLGNQAAAFAPVPGLSARALVTLAPSADPSLLPEPLRVLAGDARPRRAEVAGLRAWAYPPAAQEGGRTAQVTVVPTTAGSLTIACIAPAAVWSGAAGCARRVTAVSLGGAQALVPSASLAFRRRLAPVLDRLGVRRAELRAGLRSEATRGRSRSAARLAHAHRRAMAALTPSASATGAQRRIMRELRRSGRSYGRLAVATRSGWPVRRQRAQLAIRRSERALAAAVARVR